MNSFLNQPFIWIVVAGVVLAVLAFLASRQSKGATRITLTSIGVACLLVPAYLVVAVYAPELIDARIRTYKALYREIESGMTRDQVLAMVDKHYPAGGMRQRPKIMKDTFEELGFFMNPEHSREPNCEGIFLDLADGRVVGKRYSRD